MRVLVDTTVLSLALRRPRGQLLNEIQQQTVATFRQLSHDDLAVLIGPIRQEVLSGIRLRKQFDELRDVLDGFEYLPLQLADYDLAAECDNQCRARGIAPGDIDMMICATAIRYQLPVMTVDNDFKLYSRIFSIQLMAH